MTTQQIHSILKQIVDILVELKSIRIQNTMNESKIHNLEEELKKIQHLCDHKYESGESAFKSQFLISVCEICGKEE